MQLTKIEGALWYEYDQNNSGGYFERDDFVADVVYVQARSAREAESIIRELIDGADAWNFCDCCGERWYLDTEGYENPTRYGENVLETGIQFFSKNGYALFHGLNGRTLKLNADGSVVELGKLEESK